MLEKQVMLQVLDVHWKEHLGEIDHLRNSIGLRAYAQKNPKNEFKKEAYSMFESMLDEIDSGTVRILFSLQIANEEDVDSLKQNEQKQEITLEKADSKSFNSNELNTEEVVTNETTETIKRDEPKLGRNDLVKITNGQETQELKYKKAKSMIESGEWRIV
jgi:preprotein translocase subunit SecA